jgi:membrane protein YfhO
VQLRAGDIRRPRAPAAPGAAVRRAGAVAAGPVAIVAAAGWLMRGCLLEGRVRSADAVQLWLPHWTFLGRSIAAGRVPLWNPYEMAGVPFAADPQSGWMYAPPMLLFATLPPGAALRAMIVAQPVLGGLGTYGFCRSEGLSRTAAGVGGVALVGGLFEAGTVWQLPFAGVIAWTCLCLWALSRLYRSRRWAVRGGWCLCAAACWGQIAAAHLGLGLAMGTGALVAYSCGRILSAPRRSPARRTTAVSALAVAIAAVPVNAAYLLPRLEAAGQLSLRGGYGSLSRLAAQAGLRAGGRHGVPGRAPGWPVHTALGGALLLVVAVLAVAGAVAGRRRPVARAFIAYAVLAYLLSLSAVAGALPATARSWLPVDVYLHHPGWFGLIVVVPVAFLAAVGADAIREAVGPRGTVALAAGLAVAAAAQALLPAGFTQAQASSTLRIEPYLHPGNAVQALGGPDAGRYVVTGVRAGARADPLVFPDVGALIRRSNAGGYNPCQLRRYWVFLRAAERHGMPYDRTSFRPLRPLAANLLDIRRRISQRPSAGGGRALTVRRLPGRYGLAAVHRRWTVAATATGALADVTRPGFAPNRSLVVEGGPRAPPPAPSPGHPRRAVRARWSHDGELAVRVDSAGGMLLVRVPYARGWRATVDGAATAVFPADYVDQAVEVPAGVHTVDLRYTQPGVRRGLIASAIAAALVLLTGAAVGPALGRLRGRARKSAPAP